MQKSTNNKGKGTNGGSSTTTSTTTEAKPQRPNPANTDNGERRDYKSTEKKERR